MDLRIAYLCLFDTAAYFRYHIDSNYIIEDGESVVNDMAKNALTYSDIKEIEKILEEHKATANEETKAKIDEIIMKLGELEIRS